MWVLTGADSSRPPTIWLSFCSYKIRTRPPLRNHLPASDEQGRAAHGKSLGWAAFQVLQTGWGREGCGPWEDIRRTLADNVVAINAGVAPARLGRRGVRAGPQQQAHDLRRSRSPSTTATIRGGLAALVGQFEIGSAQD